MLRLHCVRYSYPTFRTLTKGAFASLASRRAISVLPHPVGPIMSMFLGVISSCAHKDPHCQVALIQQRNAAILHCRSPAESWKVL